MVGGRWSVDDFNDPGVTLLFAPDNDDPVAVDLDTGQQWPVSWPQSGATSVPAGEPGQVWLVEAREAHRTATLVDLTGSELGDELASIRLDTEALGAEVLRGVPGGLALRTDEGELVVYDLYGHLHRDYLGDGTVNLLDANAQDVLWCTEPCTSLQVTDGFAALAVDAPTEDGAGASSRGVESYDHAWLSPDGVRIVAVGMVRVGEGVDREMRVYEAEARSFLASTSLPLGEMQGAWTPDGRTFLFTRADPDGHSNGPHLLGEWRVGAAIRTADVPPTCATWDRSSRLRPMRASATQNTDTPVEHAW